MMWLHTDLGSCVQVTHVCMHRPANTKPHETLGAVRDMKKSKNIIVHMNVLCIEKYFLFIYRQTDVDMHMKIHFHRHTQKEQSTE